MPTDLVFGEGPLPGMQTAVFLYLKWQRAQRKETSSLVSLLIRSLIPL